MLAEDLNQRLPAAVRVFTVQRVNKKFHARRCASGWHGICIIGIYA